MFRFAGFTTEAGTAFRSPCLYAPRSAAHPLRCPPDDATPMNVTLRLLCRKTKPPHR